MSYNNLQFFCIQRWDSIVVKIWQIVCFCIGIIGLGYFSFYPLVQYQCNACAAVLITPFITIQHRILKPIKDWYAMFEYVADMHKKMLQLADERDQLLSEVIALKGSKEFVQATKELVRYKKRYDIDQYQLAHIILKQMSDYEHSMLIDQGSVHGVEKDMVAIYKNVLVGKVIEVYPYWSKVCLITDPLCKVAVICPQTQAEGIAEGFCDKDYFIVSHVNHLDTIKEGDYILSSGAGLIFPKGFGLGIIERFVKDGLFYTITARPLISIDRIEYCYLIKKGMES